MVARAALYTILTIQEQHVTSIMDLSPGNANLQNCCGIKQHLRTFERSKLTMLWLIPIPPLAGARRTKPPRSAFKPFCITNFPHNMPPQLVGVSIHVFVSVNIYIYIYLCRIQRPNTRPLKDVTALFLRPFLNGVGLSSCPASPGLDSGQPMAACRACNKYAQYNLILSHERGYGYDNESSLAYPS